MLESVLSEAVQISCVPCNLVLPFISNGFIKEMMFMCDLFSENKEWREIYGHILIKVPP